jgi:hypothetical protein
MYIVNQINALGVWEQATPLNLRTLWDGLYINRLWQLEINSLVMASPSSTSESFVLESSVGAGRWQVY